MLDYIPGILAFAAVIVAIGGEKKTNPAKRGLRRLTKTGWAVLTLAVIALLTGLAATRRSQLALEAQANQRKILRSVADAEARLALHTITGCFFLLLGDDGPNARFALVPPHVFDSKRIQAAQSIEIREPLQIFFPPTSWAELLKSSADRGSQQLTQALQIYAPYLDPEVLALLSELRTSDFLVLRLRGLDDYVSANKEVKKLCFYFVDPPGMHDHMDTGYDRFWKIVLRLDMILEKDETRLEHRVASE